MNRLQRVIVVDDNRSYAEGVCFDLQDADLPALVLDPLPATLDAAVEKIIAEGWAAVCDHRLSNRSSVDYWGAELAARLIRRQLPAVLITEYSDSDMATTIRRQRHSLPVVLKRDEVAFDRLKLAIDTCILEIQGRPLPSRIAGRALLKVEDRDEMSGEAVLQVRIPGWNPRHIVPLPLDMLPESLRVSAQPGAWFTVRTNTGAESADELFFDEFNLALEPDPEDGLA